MQIGHQLNRMGILFSNSFPVVLPKATGYERPTAGFRHGQPSRHAAHGVEG